MSYMWYNVNLIVWWGFFCTSQEICFCWIDFMALLIYIHVLYVLAIWQKINGKDWGLKKKLLFFKWSWQDLQDVVIQIHVHVVVFYLRSTYIINGFITTELSNWVH